MSARKHDGIFIWLFIAAIVFVIFGAVTNIIGWKNCEGAYVKEFGWPGYACIENR